MSKLRNVVVAFLALPALMVTSAFSEATGIAGCKTGMFIDRVLHPPRHIFRSLG